MFDWKKMLRRFMGKDSVRVVKKDDTTRIFMVKRYQVPPGDVRHTPACWMKRRVTKRSTGEKTDTAVLRCPNPNCSKLYWLLGHKIEANGDVDPSVVCPSGCGFHAFISLIDWLATPVIDDDDDDDDSFARESKPNNQGENHDAFGF